MSTSGTCTSAATSSLPDRLWKELRELADDGLARRAATTGMAMNERVRGEVYLFIVDMIAHEVDQLDQEPETAPGRTLEEAL